MASGIKPLRLSKTRTASLVKYLRVGNVHYPIPSQKKEAEQAFRWRRRAWLSEMRKRRKYNAARATKEKQ